MTIKTSKQGQNPWKIMNRRVAMNQLNQENRSRAFIEEKALQELKALIRRNDDNMVTRLAAQLTQTEKPVYFDRYEEKAIIVIN
jgi:hypothetical protein